VTDVRGDDTETPWYDRVDASGPHGGPAHWGADPATRWHDDVWDDPAVLTASQTARVVRRSRVLRWVALGIALVVVVAAVVGGFIGLWLIRQINPGGTSDEAETFIVSDTDSLVSIATRLKAQGFITHSGVFQWYVKRDGSLEAEPGYYTLRRRDTMGNIAAALRRSPNATFTSVTFPEGFTVAQMARRLSTRVPRLSEEEFLAASADGEVVSPYLPAGVRSLEGLLFPDTYQVSNAESERQVIVRMVRLTERVGRQEGMDDSLKRGVLSPYEVLIVASLIEREARFEEDRPKIARVILNRLALGMPLQIDATLYYGADPDTPFSVLKQRDTPYNTYLRTGLPPTPIANPGRASIRAALNPVVDPPPGDPICRTLSDPTNCRYLYYVLSDRLGNHVFAATLEQHEENVARARAEGVLP